MEKGKRKEEERRNNMESCIVSHHHHLRMNLKHEGKKPEKRRQVKAISHIYSVHMKKELVRMDGVVEVQGTKK